MIYSFKKETKATWIEWALETLVSSSWLFIWVSLEKSFNTYEYPYVVNVYNCTLSAFLIPNLKIKWDKKWWKHFRKYEVVLI